VISFLEKKTTHASPLYRQDVAQTETVEVLAKAGFFADDPGDNPQLLCDTDHETVLQIPTRDQASFGTQLLMLLRREQISLVKNPAPMIINWF